jgi:hypothetical protein
MTTLKAVSSTEVEVTNNGRTRRVSVAALLAVDEAIDSTVRYAIANIGTDVKVPGKTDRKPRHAVVHAILQ